jgi:cell division protein FtsB
MAWFGKTSDPLSQRERALNDEIAQLESRIKKLAAATHQEEEQQPRLRSTAIPHGSTVSYSSSHHSHGELTSAPKAADPIFEDVHSDKLKSRTEQSRETRSHYNDLGVRKYDLAALFSRFRNHVQGPSATNPKLVNYLAAGGIQGLRPLRYEKRVARNRLIILVLILFLTMLGIALAFFRHR